MATMKFFGAIGYAVESVQSKPGVWTDQMIERNYYGDIVRNTRRLDEVEKIAKDLSVGNSVRILADAYALNHFHAMKYIEWAGAFWTVTDVEVQSPRLLIRLGGVYNGTRAPRNPEETESESDSG